MQRSTTNVNYDFSGRTALITGGANGIGLATAQRLAMEGARVLIADLDEAAARDLANRLGGHAFELDVAKREDVVALKERLDKQGYTVDLLVNCAGIVQDPLSPDVLDCEVYQRVMNVDLMGTWHMCSVFGTAMANRGDGAIVNISSVAGMRSMPLFAYSPAKAGVISLTECLAAEWGRNGVRVNSLSPGYTVTAALQSQIDKGYRDPEKLKANSVLGKLIRPEDIAASIAFLLSSEASMITGINLPVDAGWLVSGSWSTFGGVRPARVPRVDEH